MRYLVLKDVDSTLLKKGMIIDEQDQVEMRIILDDKFYNANPHAFKRIDEKEPQ